MTQACSHASQQVPPALHNENDCQGLDFSKLNSRLGSLLLDLQTGSEQVRGVWDIWHESSNDGPSAVLDKPQTAPPPGSPIDQTTLLSYFAHGISDEKSETLDTTAELDLNALNFNDDTNSHIREAT